MLHCGSSRGAPAARNIDGSALSLFLSLCGQAVAGGISLRPKGNSPQFIRRTYRSIAREKGFGRAGRARGEKITLIENHLSLCSV